MKVVLYALAVISAVYYVRNGHDVGLLFSAMLFIVGSLTNKNKKV